MHAYVFSTGESNIHWNILFMTIPAVAFGGQVSPFINNRVDGEKWGDCCFGVPWAVKHLVGILS